jgi:predicted nucleic acid-binding Zn ribbon protein
MGMRIGTGHWRKVRDEAPRTCVVCGGEYKAKQQKQQYCGNPCRVAAGKTRRLQRIAQGIMQQLMAVYGPAMPAGKSTIATQSDDRRG